MSLNLTCPQEQQQGPARDTARAVPPSRQTFPAFSASGLRLSTVSSAALMQPYETEAASRSDVVSNAHLDDDSSPGPPGTATPQTTTPTTPDGAQAHQNGGVSNGPPFSTADQPIIVPQNSSIVEWRSWKIEVPYLTLLLFIALLFITTISTLTGISRRNSGFARQSQPPGFLQRHPGLQKAIWEQGIFYTALPAFIMTVYQTMWNAAVMAFADRQPYVDLLKPGGRHPRRTILLDYKMEPILSRWILACQNKHFLLSACMLSSLVLSFGTVPLTSFLFTMDIAMSNATFPLTADTYFNATIAADLPAVRNMPDVRIALDTAAGVQLQNLSLPPRTDGVFAYPHFSSQVDLGSSNLSIQAEAYGADCDCRVVPDSEYETKTSWVDPMAMLIEVNAIDRMCAISHTLPVRTSPWSPDIFMTTWNTPHCSEQSGWSRISLLAARYDKISQTVQNFSLVTCKMSYFSTSGELLQRSEPGMRPRLLRFQEDRQKRRELAWNAIMPARMFLEMHVHLLRYLDVRARVDANEFAMDIYRMAQQANLNEPMQPGALAEAMRGLFETFYAIFASLYLFKDRSEPYNATGLYAREEKRLFVVPVVAYVILGVLGATALLNACLFFSSQERSILKEEPFGLMSFAGLLYKSELNTLLMNEIVETAQDARRARESAKQMYALEKVSWLYDTTAGRITFQGGPLEMQALTGSSQAQRPARQAWRRVKARGKSVGGRLAVDMEALYQAICNRASTASLHLQAGAKAVWGATGGAYLHVQRKLAELM